MIGKFVKTVLCPLFFVFRLSSFSTKFDEIVDSGAKDKGQRTKDRKQNGFSLLELVIAMFVIIILLSVAIPAYQKSVQMARENVLKANLDAMRRGINQYGADKGKLPQSIDDLVTDKYLREKPVDPITEKNEWTEVRGADVNSVEGEEGLTDVKSTAEGEDSDGKPFSEY